MAGDRRNVLMMQVSAAAARTILGEYDAAEVAIRAALVPDASHWPMLDQPERVNAVLDEVLAAVP